MNMFLMKINCKQASRCDFEVGVPPIPVPEDTLAGFSLHLNFLGEQQAVSGPMEIGDSILIECLESGKEKHLIRFLSLSFTF